MGTAEFGNLRVRRPHPSANGKKQLQNGYKDQFNASVDRLEWDSLSGMSLSFLNFRLERATCWRRWWFLRGSPSMFLRLRIIAPIRMPLVFFEHRSLFKLFQLASHSLRRGTQSTPPPTRPLCRRAPRRMHSAGTSRVEARK